MAGNGPTKIGELAMGKYFKSFEDLKAAFVDDDGNTIETIDNDSDATEDYSRRSRFGRNPESNVIEFQGRSHKYMSFSDFIEKYVCLPTKRG
jgi:hypothetical protein